VSTLISDFDNASNVESVTYQMKLADYPRGLNRAKINDLANGVAPYTQQEERDNNIEVNVNPLNGTKIFHDARSQAMNGLMKPGKFFTASTDAGPVHKRREWETLVNRNINRLMKASLPYFEVMRSKIAQLVLHGISPCAWEDRHQWAPEAFGVEDVFVPANTLLTMKNLPFFAIYRQYTGAQLKRLVSGPKTDPGWNMPMVNSLIQWADKETSKLTGTVWPEVWSPEKMAERIKGDGGLYASDAATTIDCYDFYFYSFDKKNSGWYRRIVPDAYGQPGVGSDGNPMRGSKKADWPDKLEGFIYTSRNRKYADKLSEIIGWQFADLSAVGPFRYHSVRALGFLVWAVAFLQMRLYCRIQESTFESLLQYFRVKSMDDFERALKVELVNRGVLDETIQMIPQAERWQTNVPLAEFAYQQNQQIISENSASYIQKQEFTDRSERKTKFQVGAELNAAASLVSAALMQAYKYQQFEYREIFRRFCRANSRDPDVREFRVQCLKEIPEKYLIPDAWDISTEQVMGAGNKTLEMNIAQQLLEMRNLYDPEPQRRILRDVTLAITDDPSRAEQLVPDQPVQVTDSVHDAQLTMGTLMMGLPVAVKTGINHIEFVETLLRMMTMVVQRIEQSGGMASEEQIIGLQTVAQHISQHMQIIGQDEEEKERVKQYGDALGKLLNMVKAYAQRLQEQRQKQNGQAQLSQEEAAKIMAIQQTAAAKVRNMRESHGLRTAERQVQFEQSQKQDAEKHRMEMLKKAAEVQGDIAAKDLQTASAIRTNRMKSFTE
jgi:hypothetical protein